MPAPATAQPRNSETTEFAAKILRQPERSNDLPLPHRKALIRPYSDRLGPFDNDWGVKSRDETIAPALGDQDFGMGWVAFDFLAQAVDVGFQRVR